MADIHLPELQVLTLFGNHIDIDTDDPTELLNYLGCQFDTIRAVCPNLLELSIEGNPAVERILQQEYETREDYLESPGFDLDHF